MERWRLLSPCNSQGQMGNTEELDAHSTLGTPGEERRWRLLADEDNFDVLILIWPWHGAAMFTIVKCVKGFAAIITLRVLGGGPITPYVAFFFTPVVSREARGT